MTEAYDLVAIGAGPAGESAAELAAFYGASLGRHREEPARRDGNNHRRRADENAPRSGPIPDRVPRPPYLRPPPGRGTGHRFAHNQEADPRRFRAVAESDCRKYRETQRRLPPGQCSPRPRSNPSGRNARRTGAHAGGEGDSDRLWFASDAPEKHPVRRPRRLRLGHNPSPWVHTEGHPHRGRRAGWGRVRNDFPRAGRARDARAYGRSPDADDGRRDVSPDGRAVPPVGGDGRPWRSRGYNRPHGGWQPRSLALNWREIPTGHGSVRRRTDRQHRRTGPGCRGRKDRLPWQNRRR